METSWHRSWSGDRKFLPRSQGQGIEKIQTVLVPLQAQIAVLFGQPEGTLEDLHTGVTKLSKGEQITCKECGYDIFKKSHKPDCELYLQAVDVMTKPATPRH